MFLYLLFGRGLILDGWPGLFYVFQRTLAETLLALRLISEREGMEQGGTHYRVDTPFILNGVHAANPGLPGIFSLNGTTFPGLLPVTILTPSTSPSGTEFRGIVAPASSALPSSPSSHLRPYAPPWTWRRRLNAVARQGWAPGLLCLVLDVVTWLVIYGLVVRLRGDMAYGEPLPFVSVDLLGLGAIVVTLFVIGGYDRRTDHCSLGYMSEHILAVGAAVVLASLLIYGVASSGQAFRPSRGALLASFGLFIPVSLAYRRMVSRAVAVDSTRKCFLVLGAGETARHFYESYLSSRSGQRLRFVELAPAGATGGNGSAVGRPIAGAGSPLVEGNVLARVAEIGPESSGVILADESPGALSPTLVDQLVRLHFQRVPVYTMESFYETHWRRVPAHALDPAWPLQMGFQLARDSPYAHVKRVFDVVFAALALALSSPVLLLLTLATWLDSGRPALFRQTRIGRDGQSFTILKFRTMHARPAAPAGETLTDAELYTQPGDRRVTRLGRWLRKLRLDELPQLWNVFAGDMSLIGPRAEWDRLARRYEASIPSYAFRHLVKPGITGWAQVNYPYGASDADALQKLKYDLYYLRYYSLKLDAMIILKTVHIMLFGKGQ